ncbi:hypothetical protein LXL04_038535 [Taraxacum kok-saghyz]
MHGGFGKQKFDSPENLGVDVAQNDEELVDKEFADEEACKETIRMMTPNPNLHKELNNMRVDTLGYHLYGPKNIFYKWYKHVVYPLTCVHECEMGDVISTGDQSDMREDGGGINNSGVPARCAGDSFIRRMVSFRKTGRPVTSFRNDGIRIMSHRPHFFDEWFHLQKHDKMFSFICFRFSKPYDN